MKTPKSPKNEELTPSKKKLKQARLPFKIISDISPEPDTPPSRKRKLSTPNPEPVTKIGKVTKENKSVATVFIISDDDSKDSTVIEKEEKLVNPLIKLVDNAWKKKQQKSKTLKKKKGKKSEATNCAVEPIENIAENDNKNFTNVENMEIDSDNVGDTEEASEICEPKENILDEDKIENNGANDKEVIILTDSNHEPEQDILCGDKTKSAEQNSIDSKKKESVSHTEDTDVYNESKRHVDSEIQNESEFNNKSELQNDPELHNETELQNEFEVHDKSEVVDESEVHNASEVHFESEVHNDTELQNESEVHDESEVVDESEVHNESEVHFESEVHNDTELQNESELQNKPISTTPKHSTRNKEKEKNKLNNSQLNMADDSMTSNCSTPRRSMRSSSVTKNQGDVSLNESSTNLTPKQLQKKLDSAKKKEEREKDKLERDKKKQQEKDDRAKQKQEKEEQRKREKEEKEEAKRKEKEEKEEQKRKEREEKEQQKEQEKKLKEEQKRKEKEGKEEQRKREKEAKDEEKRKKQEALELEKMEQEQKKKKAAEAFVNFFVPKQKHDKDQTTVGPVSKSSVLSSFTIKSDMRLAPTVRTNLTDKRREALDNVLMQQNIAESSLYIKTLKLGLNKPLSSGKTWPLEDKDDMDVMIVEDELPPMDGAGEILTCDSVVREKLHPKLFSFHENRRPPYWGTWRKKSTYINPRRPFQQDQKHLDYEVDSDEDWEEEQEGESIDGSAAGSDDEQDADEYEVDNEVFVPHGYLSDEEATMEEDDVLSLSPETQKARLKYLEDEFEMELKKPTEKLKPRLYGLLWETSDGSKPEHCVDALWNYFQKLSMVMDDPTPFLQPSSEPEEAEKKKVKKKKSQPESDQQSPKTEKKKKQDNKESRKSKTDSKKNTPDLKKNQLGINSFLTKIKS